MDLSFTIEEMDLELKRRGWRFDEEDGSYRRFEGTDNEQFISVPDDFERLLAFTEELEKREITTLDDYVHQIEQHAVHRAADIRFTNAILERLMKNSKKLHQQLLQTKAYLSHPKAPKIQGEDTFTIFASLSLFCAKELGLSQGIWLRVASRLADNIFEDFEGEYVDPHTDKVVSVPEKVCACTGKEN